MFTANWAHLLFCKNTVCAPGLNRVSLCQTVFLVGFFAPFCAEASCSNVCLLTRCESLFQNKHRKGVVLRNAVASTHALCLENELSHFFFFKCFLIFLFRFVLSCCAAYYHKQRPALKSCCVMSETWNRRTRPVNCDKFPSAAECKSLFHTCCSAQIFMTEYIKVWVCCFVTLELQCWCLVNLDITQYSNMTANLR